MHIRLEYQQKIPKDRPTYLIEYNEKNIHEYIHFINTITN